MTEEVKEIMEQLEEAGYDYALAVATDAEVKQGAACGQLSIIAANAQKALDEAV